MKEVKDPDLTGLTDHPPFSVQTTDDEQNGFERSAPRLPPPALTVVGQMERRVNRERWCMDD